MATATAERKSSAKKKGSKRPQYPDNIRAASKRARELLGGGHAPGPKQHVAVRKALGDGDPLKAIGLSETALREYASRKRDLDREQSAKLREVAASVGDPFARGRSFAAIALAYVEELKAQSAGS